MKYYLQGLSQRFYDLFKLSFPKSIRLYYNLDSRSYGRLYDLSLLLTNLEERIFCLFFCSKIPLPKRHRNILSEKLTLQNTKKQLQEFQQVERYMGQQSFDKRKVIN